MVGFILQFRGPGLGLTMCQEKPCSGETKDMVIRGRLLGSGEGLRQSWRECSESQEVETELESAF